MEFRNPRWLANYLVRNEKRSGRRCADYITGYKSGITDGVECNPEETYRNNPKTLSLRLIEVNPVLRPPLPAAGFILD